ncbi:glycosyltransferase [Desulfovibrio mangrovi]|uniref:glycosyltransferase family 2 protein n=1 Tax=Desulfovibrio mangrovi TaxID=2976983 RepID=UPI0022474E93|nr:glycosyltransferase [Desulfovibrio mangrovi]UZP66204.1 glycosyltransferase [Desulfovibrio mangrovi]
MSASEHSALRSAPAAAHRPDVTLVTYTCNDASHTRALLESVATWTVWPRRVIVVDDGSDVPFVTDWNLLPVTILRHPENRGRTEAKRTGLSAAESRFILSMDNDVRLSPDWLRTCLPMAARPEVGIASTPLRHASGDSPAARYTAHAYSLQLGVSGDVSFVSGGVWLLRSEIWRNVGGFGDYQEQYGEDARFCERLRAAGYRLVLTTETEACEVRLLPRHVIVKRGWRWHGYHIKVALDAGHPLDEACNVLLHTMRERMARSVAADRLFLYFDLLYLVYGMTDLFRHAAQTRPEAGAYTNAPLAAALVLLEDCPALRGLLCEDLGCLSVTCPDSGATRNTMPMLDFAALLQPVMASADCSVLEAAVPLLREE